MSAEPQIAGMGTVTVPAVVHSGSVTTSYAKCPHHKGKCPACDEAVLDGKPPASKLSASLRAAAPADLCAQLDELIRQAEHLDRKELVTGAGQALFERLKRLLPKDVRDPTWEPQGLFGHIGRLFGWEPEKPAKDALSLLERARDKHWINQTCLDAAAKLPLDRDAKPASSEDLRRLAAFLPILAEQIHTDRRLPRQG